MSDLSHSVELVAAIYVIYTLELSYNELQDYVWVLLCITFYKNVLHTKKVWIKTDQYQTPAVTLSLLKNIKKIKLSKNKKTLLFDFH